MCNRIIVVTLSFYHSVVQHRISKMADFCLNQNLSLFIIDLLYFQPYKGEKASLLALTLLEYVSSKLKRVQICIQKQTNKGQIIYHATTLKFISTLKWNKNL